MDARSAPLRICLVNAYFPPYVPGGAEISMELTARLLAERGHEVSVVVPGPDGRAEKEMREGFIVHWVPSRSRLAPGHRLDQSTYAGSPTFVRELTDGILHVGREAAVQVLHGQNAISWEPTVRAARALGIPSVATVRDPSVLCPTGICMMDDPALFPTPCGGLWSMLWCSHAYLIRTGASMSWPHQVVHAQRLWSARTRQRRWLSRAGAVIAISDALGVQLQRHAVRGEHPPHRVYNAVVAPPDAADDALVLRQYGLEPRRYFLIAGKKSLGKGTFVAIAAAGHRARVAGRAPLAFFGPGVVLPRADGVLDFPPVAQQQLQYLVRQALAVVVPSLVFEGLNRGMLDALGAGVPLVVTDSGGQREGVIDGENGYVVPKGNVEALAAALERIASWDESQRKRAAWVSERLVDNRFNTHAETTRLEAIYGDLVNVA